MVKSGGHILTMSLALVASAAGADVKAGTEAWRQGDWKKAVDEWRGPAVAGDPDAEFNLGQAYKLGRGVPADLAQAEFWYGKAAAQGHSPAVAAYGIVLFDDGKRAEAAPWLNKAAANGDPRADLILGTMLFNGDGVKTDWVRAYALITRATQASDPRMAGVVKSAGQTLAQMDGYLTPEQRQAGLAMAGQIAAQGKMLAAAPVAATATPRVLVTPRPKPTPSPSPASSPRPSPTPRASVTPRAVAAGPATVGHAATGRYRIQLGAFRDEGNARALWARVGGRTGGQPFFVRAGAVTRLQAGSFASQADAQRACHAAGPPCDVIRER